MHLSRQLAALAAGATVIATAVFAAPAAPAMADTGSVDHGQLATSAAGPVDYTVYLPPGYESEPDRRYPTVYLLHGRGDTQAAWLTVQNDLDELIVDGEIQPIIAVLPDAPWSQRGSWYVDSQFTGAGALPAGAAVETALTRDLVTHIDATYRTVDDRDARAVGGYSMGGYGALRYVTAHQDTFSAGILLSPAVYDPAPPTDSSVREFGGFGVGSNVFDSARYTALTYPATFADLDSGLPIHLFIDVGDDEWAHPTEPEHDLDLEAAQLYTHARRVPGVSAELRIRNGGHNWDVWQPGFREAIVDVAARLRSQEAPPFEGITTGSAGDDRAGGIATMGDGGSVVALNLDGPWDGYTPAGGLDVMVVGRDGDGTPRWRHPIATAVADRAYGVVPAADGGVIVAGYTRGDLDGAHATTTRDDGFAVGIGPDGARRWTLQAGDPGAADRFYAVAPDGDGGAYVAGYTSGSVDGPSAGDKDAVLGRISASGQALWWRQLGGSGEDKALAVTALADGSVVVGGISGAGMPGIAPAGGADGWLAHYDGAGTRDWVHAVATAENDQVNGLTARPDGSVVAVGHTRGTLGEAARGDNDVVVRAVDPAGNALWTTQLGTATDDRGVGALAAADGRVLVAATTYGAMGTPVGGVDIAVFEVSTDGTAGPVTQLGSRQRDGSDEWDDANLFVADAGAGRVWLTGLTYGATDQGANAGAGDVFVTSVPFGADPGPVDPTASPTGTQNPAVGGGLLGAGSGGGGAHSGLLPWTGAELASILAAGLLLILGGVGLRRWRMAGLGR